MEACQRFIVDGPSKAIVEAGAAADCPFSETCESAVMLSAVGVIIRVGNCELADQTRTYRGPLTLPEN